MKLAKASPALICDQNMYELFYTLIDSSSCLGAALAALLHVKCNLIFIKSSKKKFYMDCTQNYI